MFPEIITTRLLLRKIISSDQPKIFEALSHPDVIKYYGVSYSTLESSGTQMEFYNDLLVNETGIWWGICYKDDPGEIIGACGFNNFDKQHKNVEIGYWLLPAKQGAGIMLECMPPIIQYAFDNMQVHRITAIVETGNERSERLLHQFRFQYEGMLRDAEIKNGRFISLRYFALLNNQP